MKPIDITGKKFNRLTAIRLHHIEKYNHGTKHFWLYKCDCGNEVVLNKNNVSNGHTQSCGCFQREQTAKASSSHNLSRVRLYHIWNGIKARCYNKNNPAYKYYGGRGICICEKWKDDFKAFYDWSMNNGYKEETRKSNNYNILTIDRIDTNGNYCPENCRFVTAKEQSRNVRTNTLITYNNESRCLSEWAEIFGIDSELLRERLKRNWSFEKAISTPPEMYKNRSEKLIEYNGELRTKKGWIEFLQIHPTTFYRRMKKITPEKTE